MPLLEDSHPGIAEVKWCRNRFKPFLCIDPKVWRQGRSATPRDQTCQCMMATDEDAAGG